MRKFRQLKENEIECRVSEIDKYHGAWLTLLLYKTARTDAALLDETVGEMNWQNDYRVIDGKLYCGIGIRNESKDEWIWRWNVGTESNMEAEKGQASDAMKRAGFVWGIGAELYTAPYIKIPAEKCNIWQETKSGRYKASGKFTVEKIRYAEDGHIDALSVLFNGKRCFVWTE